MHHLKTMIWGSLKVVRVNTLSWFFVFYRYTSFLLAEDILCFFGLVSTFQHFGRVWDFIWGRRVFGSCFGTLKLLPSWIWAGNTYFIRYGDLFGCRGPVLFREPCECRKLLYCELLWCCKLCRYRELDLSLELFWYRELCCLVNLASFHELCFYELCWWRELCWLRDWWCFRKLAWFHELCRFREVWWCHEIVMRHEGSWFTNFSGFVTFVGTGFTVFFATSFIPSFVTSCSIGFATWPLRQPTMLSNLFWGCIFAKTKILDWYFSWVFCLIAREGLPVVGSYAMALHL